MWDSMISLIKLFKYVSHWFQISHFHFQISSIHEPYSQVWDLFLISVCLSMHWSSLWDYFLYHIQDSSSSFHIHTQPNKLLVLMHIIFSKLCILTIKSLSSIQWHKEKWNIILYPCFISTYQSFKCNLNIK